MENIADTYCWYDPQSKGRSTLVLRMLMTSRLLDKRALLVFCVVVLSWIIPQNAMAQADLSLTKTVSSATAPVGTNVTFTLVVANGGTKNAKIVLAEDVLPAGLTFVSEDSPASSYSAATGIWNVGKVNKNQSKTLTIVARVDVAGAITNSAEITDSDQSDPDSTPDNNDPAEDDQDSATVTGISLSALDTCYAVSDGTDTLVLIDRVLGTEYVIGATGVPDIEAMEYTIVTDEMYAADADILGTLDRTTGLFTPLANPFGNATSGATTITISDVDGLTMDPYTLQMYGANRRAGVEDVLVVIDILTGLVVDDAFGPNTDFIVIASDAPTGLVDIDDIAIDPADGTLYGIANNGGAGDQLVIIDKLTGAVSVVGAIGVADVEGLSFDPAGRLYATTGSADGFYEIDKGTGLATIVAPLTAGSDYEGLGCLTDGVNEISGKIFEDTDGNGSQDGGEVDAGNITVYLYTDTNGDGIGDVLVDSVETNAAGAYTFTFPVTGDFVVSYDGSDFPAGGTATLPVTIPVSFTGMGNTSTGNDFAYQLPIELDLVKTVSPTNTAVGQDVDFRIAVRNLGPGDASGVLVSDLLPAGVTFQSFTASSGAYNDATGIWDPAPIAAADSAVLTITARVDVVGPISNTAEVAAADANDLASTPGNNDPGEQDQDSTTLTGDPTVDLSLAKSVDEPAPDKNDTIVFTLTITNDGPSDGTGITVTDILPDSLSFTSFAGSDPTDTYNDVTGLWTVGDLAVNDTARLFITAVNDALITPMTNVAEVTAADQPDIDSTPNNANASEDDYAEATVSPTGSTGGGDGGLESDGSVGQKLAQVMFERRRQAQITGVNVDQDPVLFIGRSGAGNKRVGASATLIDVIPVHGPAKSVAVEVSPEDLIPVTNAQDIIAVDYVRPDGRRIGAMYTSLTIDGAIYEHTKVICDRLKGASLDYVDIVRVKGRPFVLAKLIHTDGSVDYSISGVAYDTGGNYVVDSRFRLDEYVVPAGVNTVFNLQAWSVSREYSVMLIEAALDQLGAAKAVTYINETENAPELPQVYVRNSYYQEGQLYIELYNEAATTSLKLTSATLGRTERSSRELFEKTVDVPSPGPANISTVVAEVGPLYDIAFFAQPQDSDFMDQVYVADGSWGFAYDIDEERNARVDRFDIAAQPDDGLGKSGLRSLERSVHLSGEIKTWAAVFRYLRPGGQSVDLSEYSYLEFDVWGEGQIRVLVEKASIRTSDHYSTVVKLPEDRQRHRIWFEDLRLGDGTGTFVPDDVVVVSFYVVGPQGRSENVELNVENLRFGGGEGDLLATVPEAVELKQNYPNPFRDRTTIYYGVSQSAHVKLTVHDMLGRRVATLSDAAQIEGRYSVEFDASNLASGMYLYRLAVDGAVETKSMLLVR